MRILNLAGVLSIQSPVLFSKFKEAEILTISPLEDEGLKGSNFIKCEIGAHSYILALLAQMAVQNMSQSELEIHHQSRDFLDALDTGFLSGESSVGEEEIEKISEFLQVCDVVIVDESLIHKHPDARNNENLLAFLQNIYKFEIVNLNDEKLRFKFTEFTPLKELESFDGSVVFLHSEDNGFRGGEYFAMVAKIKDGDEVKIKTPSIETRRKFSLDRDMKGTVAILGVNEVINYNYEVAVITKV